MKKLLLFLMLTMGLLASAQCMTPKASTFPFTGTPAASTAVNCISIVDANVIWASARSGPSTAAPHTRRVTISSDGGETFVQKICNLGPTTANQAIGNVCGVSATTGFVSCHGYNGTAGGVWKTTDAGTTWTKQNSALYNNATSFPNLVYFFDENNGVTMGDPADGYFEIYTTTNGGTNWTRVAATNMPDPRSDLVDVEYGLTNVFTTTGNTIWIGTTYGRLLRSTDMGATWTAIDTPITDFGGGLNAASGYSGNMTFSSDMIGALTDSEYSFWKTTDGGATWVQDTNGIPRQWDIAYVPGTTVMVCNGEDLISGTDRGISYSYDDGATWNDCTDIYGSMAGGISLLDINTFFIAGFATSTTVGGILKYTGGQLLSGLATFNDAFSANTFTATPNPATNNLNVAGKNIANVSVFDLLGKQVLNSNFNSLNDVNLNISGLNNGIYMLKVTNDLGNTTTLKVVKQ